MKEVYEKLKNRVLEGENCQENEENNKEKLLKKKKKKAQTEEEENEENEFQTNKIKKKISNC